MKFLQRVLSGAGLSGVVLSGGCVLLAGCGGFSYTGPVNPVLPVYPEPNSCKTTTTTSPALPAPTSNYGAQPATITVLAGKTPIVGASVQLYAAGTAGNGSAPTALLSSPLLSGTNGQVYVKTGFTCPLSNSVIYAVARGGSVSGAANAGVVLATVLGPCATVVNGSAYVMNEATTVATAWGMSQFLSGENIGASATNVSGITLAAATVANLVNIGSGAVPGRNFPTAGIAPAGKVNSLANLLNGCAAASGGTSAACTQLYTAAGVASGTQDTFSAAIQVVKNPGTNVAGLYAQSTQTGVYGPVLAAAPSDWTLAVTYAGGGMNNPTALSVDSTGKVWVANYYSVASLFSNTGTPMFTAGVTGNGLYNSYGGAVDVNDVAWIPNEQSPYQVNNGLGTVTLVNNTGTSPAVYSAGGFDFPIAVAFDTSGTAWVVDYGNSHLTLVSGTGAPLSGATGYTATNFVFPVAVATDSKCNGYLTNQSTDTVTQVFADGSQFTDYVVGQGPSGVAVDGSDYVWTANYYDDSVGLVSPAGKVLSSGGFKGGGIVHPQGIAIDGGGNVWVANFRGPALSELAGSAAKVPGAVISPSTGWGPDSGLLEAYALAIDASGNLWVTNLGSNTLTEFVGLAVPVKTPMLGPVRVP